MDDAPAYTNAVRIGYARVSDRNQDHLCLGLASLGSASLWK